MRVLGAALLALAPLFGAASILGRAAAPAPASPCTATAPAGEDYELSITRPSVRVPRGGVAEVVLCISRAPGFDAPIRVRAELLPEGVDAHSLLVPAGETTATLRFAAERAAPPGVGPDSVIVAAAYGHVHTLGLSVAVTGSRDRGASDPNEDEGKAAIAALRSSTRPPKHRATLASLEHRAHPRTRR